MKKTKQSGRLSADNLALLAKRAGNLARQAEMAENLARQDKNEGIPNWES